MGTHFAVAVLNRKEASRVLPGVVGVIQATEVIKLILGKGRPLVGRTARPAEPTARSAR